VLQLFRQPGPSRFEVDLAVGLVGERVDDRVRRRPKAHEAVDGA
jgi:hypothetical protein